MQQHLSPFVWAWQPPAWNPRGNPPTPGSPLSKAIPHKLDKCLSLQAQAALSGQLVVARQQHANVCMQLQKEHAALQQAALQEHALQKVTCPHLPAFMYPPPPASSRNPLLWLLDTHRRGATS